MNGSLADGALVPRAAAAFALLAPGPAHRQLGRRGLEDTGEEAARPLVRLIADDPLRRTVHNHAVVHKGQRDR